MSKIEECLGVKVYQATVAGSILLGVLITGNNNGIIVPHIIDEAELKLISNVGGVEVGLANTKWTAMGNILVANDNGGLIDPNAPNNLILELSGALKIPIEKGEINGLPYVGSLAVATPKGALTHPNIEEGERTKLERILGVESEPCTVNGGTPLPKSGVLANSNGTIVGNLTSGAEIAVIANILKA